MEQRNFSPRELLLAGKWSSLLFTTYSLSLSFLESVPLAAVNRSFKNFKVLADLSGYLSSLSDVGAIGVGRDYDLVPIKVLGGVFHPKISLLADEGGNVRATVGSGNLSFGGWGYNNEVLEVLRPGRDSQCFADMAAMLEAISNESMRGNRLTCLRPPGLDHFIEIASRSSQAPGEGRSRMLHTMDGSLIPQIREMTDELGGVRRLNVLSPFFSKHHGVKALAEGLECEDVAVAVPPVAPSIFDFVAASAVGFNVKSVSSGLFEDSRSLHSKLYDIECARGRLIVTGSANATTPALLGQNVEAVVVRPVDLALSFGWRETSRADNRITAEREPSEAPGAGLVADYNGGVIVGRVIGEAIDEDWEAFLSAGTRRQRVGLVRVDEKGSFSFEPPPAMDPIALGSAAQVILIRGEIELRGWLVLRDLIQAISRRGPIARAIGRILSGLDTLNDVGAILDYFARDPKLLFDAAERSGGGRNDRRGMMRLYEGDLAALRATSALDMASKWSGLGAGHSGDALIEALIRHFATALPASNDDASDDEDDAALPRKRGGKGEKDKQPTRRQRLQKPLVETAFDRLFKKLDEHPPGSNRVPGLFILFDMMIQIVPRTEAPDELLSVLIEKWMRAAADARPTETDPTLLDQCMSILTARMVIENPALAPRMHGVLQSWLGRALDDDFKLLFEPYSEGLEERRIYPGGTADEWKRAWSNITNSTTHWGIIDELRRAILAGASNIVLPECVSAEEGMAIKKAADGTGRPGKIVYITSRRTGAASCPGCNIVLATEQRSRLRKDRIASCKGISCSRVIIDVSL